MLKVGQITLLNGKWAMLDKKKVEIIKVWYSIFCVIIDDKEFTQSVKMEKLQLLRNRLKIESPELEQTIKQIKN